MEKSASAVEVRSAITYPDKPISAEECIAADYAMIEAKKAYADILLDPLAEEHENHQSNCEWGLGNLLLAEARTQEIAIHNKLWQAGQINRQNLIATPEMIGRRQ